MSVSIQGLRDWSLQRITAVYMTLYTIFMIIAIATYEPNTYAMWKSFFSVLWVQVPTLICLVGILWHAWIGIWTVLTDYVHCSYARTLIKLIVLLALLVYFFWGVQIIWGIPVVWKLI